MGFENMGLKKDIVELLARLKYKEPLDIQRAVIPKATQGRNVVFLSRTGSGKTLAYLLGFLGKINKTQGAQMMVVVPTRELCMQVGREIRTICDQLGIKVGIFHGGGEHAGEHSILSRKNQIIVGTPGRLLQHINDKNLKVGEVRYLVFDESDQMFDNQFYKDCIYLKKRASNDAQIILASATISNKVEEFIEEEIGEHELIQVGDIIPKSIIQEKLYCEILEKNALLLDLLSGRKVKRVMIFCNTKIKSTSIAEFFRVNGFRAISLNGDLSQNERKEHLAQFKQGRIQILVATDVAARGIHIDDVDAIINYDVPTRDEFYVHRIGRTGRLNARGNALTLICPQDVERFERIEESYHLHIKDITKR